MNSIKMAKEVVVWETLSDLSLISAHHLPRSQSYLLWETFPRWNWCSPVIRTLRMVCTVQGVMPSTGLLCLTFYLPFLSVCVFVHMCVFYLVVCLTFVAVVVGDLSQSVWVLSLRLFTSSDTIFASCGFWRKPDACTHQMQPNSDSQFCASNPPPVGDSRCEEQNFLCLPGYICCLGLWQQMTRNWVAFENNGGFNFSQFGSLSVIMVC